MITKYYNALNAINFLYFLRELEFRYNTRDLNSNMKLRELKEILNYCASTCNYVFYEIDDLNEYLKLDIISMKMEKKRKRRKYN